MTTILTNYIKECWSWPIQWARANLTELFAGVTTFAAMAYIAFVNPAILQPLGMAPGAVFIWTCLTTAAASLFAARYMNLPTALACSMGLNTFTANFARLNHVPWPNLLCSCEIASIFVLICSLGTYRIQLINSIPPQIFSAIKAGIGAMLANVAINELAQYASDVGPLPATLLFIIGISIIIGSSLWLAHIDKKSRYYWCAETVDSASFFLSILLLLPLAWAFYPATKFNPGTSRIMWVWMQPDDPWKQITGQATVITSLGYAIAVGFIMLTDIAGSPVDFLGDPKESRGKNIRLADKAALITKSFLVDALSNIVAPVAGVTPLVYYAENHAGWEAEGRSGISIVVVSLGFLVMAVFGGICIWLRIPFADVIPRVVVAPILFVVGLKMIAGSFGISGAAVADAEADAQIPLPMINKLVTQQEAAPGQIYYLLPAAITTVFATKTGLDVAIAAGITTYMVISFFPENYLGVDELKGRKINTIYLAALVVLALNIYMAFA